jgi:hypothetical protein
MRLPPPSAISCGGGFSGADRGAVFIVARVNSDESVKTKKSRPSFLGK